MIETAVPGDIVYYKLSKADVALIEAQAYTVTGSLFEGRKFPAMIIELAPFAKTTARLQVFLGPASVLVQYSSPGWGAGEWHHRDEVASITYTGATTPRCNGEYVSKLACGHHVESDVQQYGSWHPCPRCGKPSDIVAIYRKHYDV